MAYCFDLIPEQILLNNNIYFCVYVVCIFLNICVFDIITTDLTFGEDVVCFTFMEAKPLVSLY